MMEQTIAAGRPLDVLVAEVVMGWTQDEYGTWHTPRVNGIAGHGVEVPTYSTDIAAAWTILPEFADFSIESENEVWGQYCVRLDVRRPNGSTYPIREHVWRFEDIPLAICCAALIAQDLQERLNQDEVIPGVNP